tara:strand:- start:255 stop:542 length:288 start_codon:yes stop_codon:yes gene_type:complete
MKKFSVILIIFFLVLVTTIIKNSTKKIDDEIFITTENLRILNKEFGKVKLEFDYLSSAEKLLEYQRLYFENELNKKDISEIKNIKNRFNDDQKQF